MSDLPSREDVKADIELLRRNAWTHNVGAPVPFSSILEAYVSGRLVDREAIDYGAAIELARTFRNLEWNHRAVRTVVDAAIGDTSA